MPIIALEAGYYRFTVIFTWDHTEDATVVQRLTSLHSNLEKYGIKHPQGLYLIGKRTFILIGQTNSAPNLQRLCSAVSFGTAISADVCHVMDAHDLAGIMAGMTPKAQKSK